MDESEIKSLALGNYIKYLYFKAGQLNLYICRCHNIRYRNIKRLKSELEEMKQIILNIENEIDKL